MKSRKKNMILTLALCAGLCVGAGVVGVNANDVAVNAAASTESFYVLDKAAVRLSDTMGLRFESYLTESALTAVQNGAEFGMLVMSKANYESNTDSWYAAQAESEGKIKKYTYTAEQISAAINDGKTGEANTETYKYRVRTAIVGMKFDTTDQELVAVGYLKNGDTVAYEWSEPRTIAYVAKAAATDYEEADEAGKAELGYDDTDLAYLADMWQQGYAAAAGMTYDETAQKYTYNAVEYTDYKTPFINQVYLLNGASEVAELSLKKAVVNEGDVASATLTAELRNFGEKDKTATPVWTLSGDAVTQEDGVVQASAVGTATVTVTFNDEYSKSVAITVSKSVVNGLVTLTDLETWGTNEANKTLVPLSAFTAVNANGVSGDAATFDGLSATSDGTNLTVNMSAVAYTGDTQKSMSVEFENAVYSNVKANIITKKITTADQIVNLKSYGKVSGYTETYKYYDTSSSSGWSPREYNDAYTLVDGTNIYKLDGYFVLGKSIDLSGKTISNPFTTDTFWVSDNKQNEYGFVGTFDGRGYTLTGGSYWEGGLFGSVGTEGVIKNLAFESATIRGKNGSWTNCAVISSVFYGQLQDVLLNVDHIYNTGCAVAQYIINAKLTNVIVYTSDTSYMCYTYAQMIYDDMTDDIGEKNFWQTRRYGYMGASTFTNCYSFGGSTSYGGPVYYGDANATWSAYNNSSSITKYDTSQSVSALTFTGFDTTMWDFSGTKAAFKAKA